MAQRVRQMTGFVPARLSIFKLAFSHKSNQATKDYAQTNNERLEYLGDAVLGTIVAEYLFKKYPNGDEGFLTKMRSKIVKRKSLNYIGDQMGLDVLLSEYNRTRLSSSMLGNAVEALVGAVYLEKGYRATKRFVIQRMLKLYVDMHELETVDDNYKSQLLEYCQKNGMQVTYKLLNKFKQDRRDRFKVAVMVNGEQVSLADDFNKKSAEQLASLRALQKLGLIDKIAPIETGRKSPNKDTAKVDRKPKRAREERKPRSTNKSTAPKEKLAVSDEKLAVTAITKRQAEKPKQTKNEKSEMGPAVAKTQKATAPASNPRKSTAAMPARKQRRNNSRLGRAIWNGIQTGGASIELVNTLGYFENQEVSATKGATPKKTKASAKTHDSSTFLKSAGQKSKRPDKKETIEPMQRQASKSSTVRKRRPIPLRLLTPIVKDASAVMAIDFAEIFGTNGSHPIDTKPQPKKTAKKQLKKPIAKAEKLSSKPNRKEKQDESSWEDTPLGLSDNAPQQAKKPAAARKQKPTATKKSVTKKTEDVAIDELDKWEDTLLEITAEVDDTASELPKMYKKSEAKTPSTRRRAQRRSTNRNKKREE